MVLPTACWPLAEGHPEGGGVTVGVGVGVRIGVTVGVAVGVCVGEFADWSVQRLLVTESQEFCWTRAPAAVELSLTFRHLPPLALTN